jgi:twinkle protein
MGHHIQKANFTGHTGCPNCGSSDARATYSDGKAYCFACERLSYDDKEIVRPSTPTKKPMNHQQYNEADIEAVKDRNITYTTAQKYGVKTAKGKVLFPYQNKDGALVAVKTRYPDKQFSFDGSASEAALFGQHLFTKGGKYITVVEGEFDALAAYQMMGSKWPVVSIKNGAAAALKGCKEQYEWLDSFDNIVIAFDGDEPGKKAASQVAELFGNKAKVVKHQKHKDACDYLVAGDVEVWNKNWWAAESYVPDGIVAGDTLWELINKPITKADVLYPWADLNDLTYGIRKGELVTVTAGSGLGKSQFVREIAYHILQKTGDNVGLMFLEEGVQKTARSLMALSLDKPIHLPDVVVTDAELKKAYDLTVGSGKVFMFDHFGSLSIDNVISRVKYMAKGLECGYVFLDHISMLVSDGANADERKALDEVMTKLRTLVQETNIALICVSHLRRPEGKGHEEGSHTSLSQLRGSASIAQLSDIVIGLERNGQAEDLVSRNTTLVRVLKNRFSGETGECGALLYTKHTGRMKQIDNSL